MKSWTKPTDNLIRNALDSVKAKTGRQYFFSKLKNPLWIEPLKARGFFRHPPGVRQLPDGYVQYPFWPEFQFLKNVANEAAEKVVEIILEIPKTDNSRFYDGVIDIALSVEASLSIRLKTRIFEYVKGECHFLAPRFDEVLHYWASSGQIESALELAEMLVAFQPDPQAMDKQKRRKENPRDWDWTTILKPLPRFEDWEYEQILEKGVRPLSEREPYKTARILIDATAAMIRLTLHQGEREKGDSDDHSTIWCPRVNEPSEDYQNSKENLVHALTFACEKVYEKAPESVTLLDQALRNQRWDVFTRIRQHLYGLHLNEQTKLWIREMILAYGNYDKWMCGFEFQRMVRLACESFGDDLLTKTEREKIFKDVLDGPSEQDFRDKIGDHFTEEAFEKLKHYFHRMRLSPFSQVLFGEYANYFQKLTAEEEKPITDDDYAPSKPKVGWVGSRSPKPSEELAKMSDEELLSFLNDWENVDRDPDDLFMYINFEGLAQEFQSVFKEFISPNRSRLKFWTENLDKIERPIYVRAMVSAINEQVKLKQFDTLEQCFDLCERILSHPDQPEEEDVSRGDESREYPDWRSSRQAVNDFVEVCLKENVPISMRDRFASLLDKLCTQYDRGLDDDKSVSNQNDQLTAAVINTRGLGLEHLVDFGYWVRRQSENKQAAVPEVFDILDKRLDPKCKFPLTLPEYAHLGLNYLGIFDLNREWAVQHKSDFFPQENPQAQAEAFGNFLRYNRPYKPVFDIIREDFEFALENIDKFKAGNDGVTDLVDTFGQHLFIYYLWEVYPLTGEDSLLERFYEKTEEDRDIWFHLFRYIGRTSKNSGKQLEEDFEEKIIGFFEWRFEKREPSELKGFTSWLDAECLDAEWRLISFSKVIDICKSENIVIYNQMDTLQGMIEDYTALVVECFAKLTDCAVSKNDNTIEIPSDKARPILRAGLDSDDVNVQENAKRARDNLIRCGHFEVLDEVN